MKLPTMKHDLISKNNKLVLEISNLRIFNDKKMTLNNISLKIHLNEIYVLVGEDKSGKTELANFIAGNIKNSFVENGKIFINDKDVTKLNPAEWKKSNLLGDFIGYFMDSNNSILDPNRKIGIQIIEKQLFNLKKNKNVKNKLLIEASNLLEEFNIKNSNVILNSLPHELTELEKIKVVLAIIIFSKPKLLILDEAFKNLNSIEKYEIRNIINKILKTNEIGVLCLTHSIDFAFKIADTIGIMYKGSIVEEGTKKEVSELPLHPYTWGLMLSIINEKNFNYNEPYTSEGKVTLFNLNALPSLFEELYFFKINLFLNPPKFFSSNTHYVYSWIYDKKVNESDVKIPSEIQKLWGKH